jgi:hypothetical protein
MARTLFLKKMLIVSGIVLPILLVSCGSDDNSTTTSKSALPAAADYAITQTELALARAEKPYLEIDLAEAKLLLKMKGALVWSCPFTLVDGDKGDMKSFAGKFQSDNRRLVRPMVEKYLFTAKDKTPDSVLQIVGKVVNVDPERLQREIPGRFQLLWGDGLVLEIRSDIQGSPAGNFKTTMVDLSQKIQRPFGEDRLIVQVTPEDAMTLYRVTQPGFPTLVIPPR